MATTKQKKLAKVIVENALVDAPINAGQMLEKVGYSKNLVKQPGRVIKAEGVQEELRLLGFDEESAKEVVGKILKDDKQASKDRLKAAEMVFKVHGSFKESERPIERGATNYTFIFNPAVQAEVKELEAKIKAQLIGATPNVG